MLRSRRGRSKGTVSGLMPLVEQLLEERHGGAVPMPPQATFYRLVRQLAHPADHPGRPVRNPPITEGRRAMTPTVALRPGEQVQIDTTRLDVLALFDDGTLGRPELTIAIDVATRAILATVLCPGGTQAVDAALLLAEMAVPHPARPSWPEALHFTHSAVLPGGRLLSLDERLKGAAARPVVMPETIVVDRGKVFVSRAFTAACETLGISVQVAPPFTPTAKSIVERTFGSINSLFCQHLPGYTGSDVTRRGRDIEREACYTVAQLQDLLDEWLVHWHHRLHEGLRHPVLPRAALTPNQMWAALVAVAGYVPVPLSGSGYLELLPVRWQAITERGIRIHHHTYDSDLLGPYRGQDSDVTARGRKWEVHTNPHDVRQIWVRLPEIGLTGIPWIHREHAPPVQRPHLAVHPHHRHPPPGRRPVRGRPRRRPRPAHAPRPHRACHPHRTAPDHPDRTHPNLPARAAVPGRPGGPGRACRRNSPRDGHRQPGRPRRHPRRATTPRPGHR
ncbi:hypothetical protein ACIOMQ_40565 [Streptomyces sp. NPDC087845]|uniref:hypothetical protein n=1 Tax=Streptomyces sp. NPDC087845 TaxID=3365806 RepID=UPI0038129C11